MVSYLQRTLCIIVILKVLTEYEPSDFYNIMTPVTDLSLFCKEMFLLWKSFDIITIDKQTTKIKY